MSAKNKPKLGPKKFKFKLLLNGDKIFELKNLLLLLERALCTERDFLREEMVDKELRLFSEGWGWNVTVCEWGMYPFGLAKLEVDSSGVGFSDSARETSSDEHVTCAGSEK